MRVGVKTVVRVLGLAWVGFMAAFAWEYTGQHNAIAASTAAPVHAVAPQPRSVPAPEATAAGTARVVYQGTITGNAAVLPPPRPVAEAPAAQLVQPRPEAQPRTAAPAQVATPPAAAAPAPAPTKVASLPVESTVQTGGALARVDLNTASVAELNGLGAGMIGRAIVAGRPYSTGEDLLSKRVLNRATYARIKDQVAAR
jgi:DNA uptake protein ComE-like DNA-binding protein